MKKMYQIVFVSLVCILVFMYLVKSSDASETKIRQRRYLSFRNNTHFFIRLNWKANMVPWTQIFAQALGFRLNYDNPPDTFHPYHHFRVMRSTMYSNLETLFDRNGLSGFDCIRRAICEMRAIDQPKGIYHKILKMTFRSSTSTKKWHNNATFEDCEISTSLCPVSLLHLSLYTDL